MPNIYFFSIIQRMNGPLMNSFMLRDSNDLKHVEERVLQMEPKQQRQLIKSLYQLENTVRPSSTSVLNDGKEKRQRTKVSWGEKSRPEKFIEGNWWIVWLPFAWDIRWLFWTNMSYSKLLVLRGRDCRIGQWLELKRSGVQALVILSTNELNNF